MFGLVFTSPLLYCFGSPINPSFGHAGYECFSLCVCIYFSLHRIKMVLRIFLCKLLSFNNTFRHRSYVIKYPHNILNSSEIF